MSASNTPGLVLGGEPRVQLLPPSIKQREKNRALRRRLGMLVAFAVVVTVLGIGWAYLQKTQADMELEAANNETTAILAQQQQYAEAAQLANLVSRATEAERAVTSTEVLWQSAFLAIREHIPGGVTLIGYDFLVPAPWEQPLLPEGPIREERSAKLVLELRGDDYAPAATFVERVASIYAFADIKIDSVSYDDGVYVTKVAMTFDADAISGRFAEAGIDTSSPEEGEAQ